MNAIVLNTSTDTPTSSKGMKRKRVVLSLHQKIDICERLERGENRNVLMKEYGVGSSTMYDIVARKVELFNLYSESRSDEFATKRKILAKPRLEQLDTALQKWLKMKQSGGELISDQLLKEKAKAFYSQINSSDNLSLSDDWLTCFKLRHDIKTVAVPNEQKPNHHEVAETYCDNFASLINEQSLTAEQLYNAEETALYWRCLPSSILEDRESTSEGLKRNKDRITVLSCVNATGTHRLKLLVVGRYDRSGAFKGVTHLPVIYKVQNNSWMDKDIFLEWFHNNFVTEVKEHFKKIGLPEESRAVLLLSKSRAHPQESDLYSDNMFAVYMPASVTSLIQPMDQGIIQNVKLNYRKNLLRKLINHDGSVQNFQAKFNIKDAIYGIACAWESVKQMILRKAWRKLWSDVMFEDASSEEEEFEGFNIRASKYVARILEVVRNAPASNPVANLKAEDVQEWINVDQSTEVSHVLTDAEIIESALNPKRTALESDSEEEDVVEEKASWSQAAENLQKFIDFAEKRSCYSAHEVMQLHIVQSCFLQKRQEATKLADIRNLFKNAPNVSPTTPTHNAIVTSISTSSNCVSEKLHFLPYLPSDMYVRDPSNCVTLSSIYPQSQFNL